MGEGGLGGGRGLWGPSFQPLVPRNLGSGVSLCSEAHLFLIRHPPLPSGGTSVWLVGPPADCWSNDLEAPTSFWPRCH